LVFSAFRSCGLKRFDRVDCVDHAPHLGAPHPETTAAVVLMLLDGAAAHAVIRGNGDPLRETRAALPGLFSAP
jgi:hypothetical protein